MDISVIWYIFLPCLDYFSFSADRFMVSVNKFREELKSKPTLRMIFEKVILSIQRKRETHTMILMTFMHTVTEP